MNTVKLVSVGNAGYDVLESTLEYFANDVLEVAFEVSRQVADVDGEGVEKFNNVHELFKNFGEREIGDYIVSVDEVDRFPLTYDYVTYNRGVDIVVRGEDGDVLGVVYFNYFVYVNDASVIKNIEADLEDSNYVGYKADDDEMLEEIEAREIDVNFETFIEAYDATGNHNFY